ncbi:hypothetical protein GCM10025867_05650 [Frondihabitans sucicola]|uniref:LLM class flavin-dependent oxidoreductase n=1 Tax=Frondihabitans sucicola TaxID=1268041 RepID=A0ABM8GIW5_9MICO|nr:hypothetical protein [Frondihabitans sucicola]BDZ48324.1 hypothetical protein GCM10025867_05650 [Frondihabitans sucicola]
MEAWIVLSHVDAVAAPPSSRVTDAFGDTFDYALCPSSPTTRAYVRDLVANVTAAADVDTVVLEAVGPLGADHNFTHEKTSGADWTTVERQLLSICFCEHCRRAYDEAGSGLEAAGLAARVRALLAPGTGAAHDPNPSRLLGDAASGVLRVRQASTRAARESVEQAAAANGVTRVRYHASADDWATGPFTALAALGDQPDAILPSAEILGTDIEAVRTRTGRLSAYTSAMPPRAIDGIGALIDETAATGVDEVMIYHAGLLGPSRWERVAQAIRRVVG